MAKMSLKDRKCEMDAFFLKIRMMVFILSFITGTVPLFSSGFAYAYDSNSQEKQAVSSVLYKVENKAKDIPVIPFQDSEAVKSLKDGDLNKFIHLWSRDGYLDGYPDREFVIYSGVTRAQLSFFLMKFVRKEPSIKQQVRSDIPSGAWYKADLEYLLSAGILLPVNGNADPDGNISRQDAALLLSKAFSLDISKADNMADVISDYSDVDTDKKKRVDFLVQYQLIDLIGDGYFAPNSDFLMYDAFICLDSIFRLLKEEQKLGITYQNRYSANVTAVKFYCDLLEGIQQGNSLRFLDEKLKKTYQKCCNIFNNKIDDNMTDAVKGTVLHDQLLLMARYDEDSEHKDLGDDFFSPFGVLINGLGGCESYAKAYEILLSMCGIENSLLYGEGDGETHVWNLVKLDNNYYHVDVTWDDPLPDVAGKAAQYFLYVTDRIMSKHHVWDRTEYPRCTSEKYNPYFLNQTVFKGMKEAAVYIQNAFIRGDKDFSIRILEYEPEQHEQFVALIKVIGKNLRIKSLKLIEIKDCFDFELTYTR